MVEDLQGYGEEDIGWMLRPTRSMTWREARYFILLVAIVSFAIGGGFLVLGLPLVLPFSGVEVLAVGLAFYVVMRDGEKREVIRIAGDQIGVETGTHELENRFEFNRFWVRVELEKPRYRYHPTRLVVASRGRRLELGRFLTEGERKAFSGILINALETNR